MAETPTRPPVPRSPAGLGRRGKALWKAISAAYELGTTEAELLHLAARTLDRISVLEEALKDAPATVEGSQGQPRANPLAAELRSEIVIVSRLLAQLGIPDEGEDGGLYGGWQGLSPSERGRKAARRRWASRGG